MKQFFMWVAIACALAISLSASAHGSTGPSARTPPSAVPLPQCPNKPWAECRPRRSTASLNFLVRSGYPWGESHSPQGFSFVFHDLHLKPFYGKVCVGPKTDEVFRMDTLIAEHRETILLEELRAGAPDFRSTLRALHRNLRSRNMTLTEVGLTKNDLKIYRARGNERAKEIAQNFHTLLAPSYLIRIRDLQAA